MQINVLIADDSSTMRSILRKVILMSGLPIGRFYEAANGQAGLDILRQETVHLVLLDLHMPVMGGQEMIQCMRDQLKLTQVPIIVISSESNPTRIKAIEGQGIYFIHKPFTPEKMRSVVEKYWQLTTNQATQQLLSQVTLEVFEKVAFLTNPSQEEEKHAQRPEVRAAICFRGAFNGCITMDVSPDLLSELARNMLGLETDQAISLEQEKDALGELANIIAGNVLARLEGEGKEKLFDLDVPHIQSLPADEQKMKAENSIHLDLEHGTVELSVFREKTAPASNQIM